MYSLKPSSIQPYAVSLLATIMGHHWWPISWSVTPNQGPLIVSIGYSMPPSGPSTWVNWGKRYGIQSPE